MFIGRTTACFNISAYHLGSIYSEQHKLYVTYVKEQHDVVQP
jgi:hypothetical protein